MKTIFLKTLFFALILFTVAVFLLSCVVTMSDAQGAFVFIFSIPVMAVAVILAWLVGRAVSPPVFYRRTPKIIAITIVLFFTLAFIPGLNVMPAMFMGMVGTVFEAATGKTPYAYFADRKAFDTLLRHAVAAKTDSVDLAKLDVTFAWDRMCVFGPYTNNAQARAVLNIDFNIEDRSIIAQSDSINALVFLYNGRVNKVVDLKRGLADFAALDTCYARDKTVFAVTQDANGRVILKHKH